MADASLRECIWWMRYDNKGKWISICKRPSSTQALFNLVPPLNSNLCAEVASPGYVVADRQPWHVPGLLNLVQPGIMVEERRKGGMVVKEKKGEFNRRKGTFQQRQSKVIERTKVIQTC